MYQDLRNCENTNKALFYGVGEFDIPPILTQQIPEPEQWIGYNYARKCRDPTQTAVHFFVDDYQFIRLWTHPDIYTEQLKRFKAVCTPDFSMYTDYPKALNIWNHYRKHWLGAYWQQHGIKVVATISWTTPESFSYCFDGEPVGGTVAISSVGTHASQFSKQLFRYGYEEMLRRLKPERVYFYGEVPDDIEGPIVKVEAFQTSIKRRIAEKAKERE